MAQLSKYQLIKMYMPVNGYGSLKELAAAWNVHENSIREYCRGKFTSPKLDDLTREYIEEGDRKLQEQRNSILTTCTN